MRIPAIVGAGLLVCGCASTPYTLTSVPVGNQVATANRGADFVASAWRDSAVTVRPVDADLHDSLALFVSVTNTSNSAANLGTENVDVSYDGKTWKPVKTYEQLRAHLDNVALGTKFAALLLTGLDGYVQGRYAGQYSANGVVATPYGVASYHVSGVDEGERLAAIEGAAQRGSNMMAAIDEAHDAGVSKLDALALRTTTVGPGQTFGGLVIADKPNLNGDHSTPILVRVSFLNDAHVVEFQAHLPGAVLDKTIDLSESDALATEAAQNIVPETPTSSATVAGESSVVTASNDVDSSAGTSTPKPCTDQDKKIAALAKENGYNYRSTCY